MAQNKLLKFQGRKKLKSKQREKKNQHIISQRATARLTANFSMTLWNLEDNEVAFCK